jgi:hypothetical protein
MFRYDCINTLILDHSNSSKLEEAASACSDGRLLSFLAPEPKGIKPCALKRWRRENWGTEWEGYRLEDIDRDDMITCTFATSQFPPLKAYDAAVALQHFNVIGVYHHHGMKRVGRYVPNLRTHVYADYQTNSELEERLDSIGGEDAIFNIFAKWEMARKEKTYEI